MSYQMHQEFLHNDEVSGLWILTKPQLYSSVAVTGLLILITSLFLGIIPRIIISVAGGLLAGFFLGSRIKGVLGYYIAFHWIHFFFRKFIARNNKIYPASLSVSSSLSKDEKDRVVVNTAQGSLPKIKQY